MATHILCPSCRTNIGEIFEFFLLAKEVYGKMKLDENSEHKSCDPSKIQFIPDSRVKLKELLDSLLQGSTHNMCCKMRLMAGVDFARIGTS